MQLTETFFFRLVLSFVILALAALVGSIVGSLFADHSLLQSWSSPAAFGRELGRAVLALPLLWLGVLRATRGFGLLFGELLLPLYFISGRRRHLLLAAVLECVKFAIFSSLTITVGSSV